MLLNCSKIQIHVCMITMMYNLLPKDYSKLFLCTLCTISGLSGTSSKNWTSFSLNDNFESFKNLLARCSTILGPESGRQPFQMFLCLQVWSDISFQVQSKEKAFERKTGANFLTILIRISCLLSKYRCLISVGTSVKWEDQLSITSLDISKDSICPLSFLCGVSLIISIEKMKVKFFFSGMYIKCSILHPLHKASK